MIISNRTRQDQIYYWFLNIINIKNFKIAYRNRNRANQITYAYACEYFKTNSMCMHMHVTTQNTLISFPNNFN